MKEKILSLLRSEEQYKSGEEISALLGVSRTAVWKAIQQLRKEGYLIDAITNKGYLLRQEPDILSDESVKAALMRFDLSDWIQAVEVTESCDSTNWMARRAAIQNAPHRSLFISGEQTAGRGRMGRTWFSEPGLNLTFSLLFRPRLLPQELNCSTLFAGLCTAMALNQCITRQKESMNGMPIGIKWPNDLVCAQSGKKIGGILIETILEENRVEALIVGIGINLNAESFPEMLKDKASSVLTEFGCRLRRVDVLGQILSVMKTFAPEFIYRDHWMNLYRSHCLTLNRPVRILTQNGQEEIGLAVDIHENGELIVMNRSGEKQTVSSGEVSVRGLLGYFE